MSADRWNLWYRGRRGPWRVVASGTREECERAEARAQLSGDYYVAHVTVDPNKKVKVT